MSNCPPITLDAITPERYESLLAKGRAQGLMLAGASGSTEYQGMTFAWNYDEAAHTLTLTCVEKPIFFPCSMIEQRIRALVG